jgi:hypothetical protein
MKTREEDQYKNWSVRGVYKMNFESLTARSSYGNYRSCIRLTGVTLPFGTGMRYSQAYACSFR